MCCKHLVILGASAGGLDPLKTIFDQAPLSGAAYFVLTHVPVGYHSHLGAILQRHTAMQVTEAEQGMRVRGNNVYTTPLDGYMRLQEGSLTITGRGETPTLPNRAIDYFLSSVLPITDALIIVVLLSGAASDGALQLGAIHARGGHVIAKLPASCSFEGMPQQAIETGFVDHVLLPADIPGRIAAIALGHRFSAPDAAWQ